MGSVAARLQPLVRAARSGLKEFAYSGLARRRWQQPGQVLAALAPQPGAKVADLGAGGGYFTFRLARAVGPSGVVYAVDTDPDMSRLLTERAAERGLPHVVAVQPEPDDPGLPEAVDLVLCVNAFHHLPDVAGYLETLASYLRPGGRVAVVEARPRWFLFGHATAPAELRAAFAAAGYTEVDAHDFLPRQSFVVFTPAS